MSTLESTLTDRYQTTVPEAVRRQLGLHKRDKISYVITPNGAVMLTRAPSPADADPVLGNFLTFLARDTADHPEQLHPITRVTRDHIQTLVQGVEVNLDAPLDPDDD